MKPNLLICGGTGFIGKHLIKLFPEYNVLTTDSKNDLRCPDTAKKVIYYSEPSAIIFLSANCGGIEFNRDNPFTLIYDNTMMGMNLIKAAVNYKVKRLICLSTTCAYPRECPVPFNEKDLFNGLPDPSNNPYSQAKRLLGTACDAVNKQYGYHYSTLIPSNLCGPGENWNKEKSHIIPKAIMIIDEAKKNNTEAIFLGDPSVTREFLDVRSAAESIKFCLENYFGDGPLNIGTGEPVTMKDLLYKIADKMSFPREKIVWNGSLIGQPRRYLDCTKINHLGWKNKISLDESLDITLKEFYERA